MSWNFGLIAVESGNEDNTNTGLNHNIRSLGWNEVGINWSDIEVLSEPIKFQNINTLGSKRPDIAIENDKIYVVWSDSNDINGAGNDGDIFFRYYDGSIWSEIQVISEPIPGQNINTGGCNIPLIAVENGKIYVVWDCTNNTNGAGTDWDIFYRCNLTGDRWEEVQVISEPVPGQDFNNETSWDTNIAVENGKIHVSWADKNDTNGAGKDWDIFYRCNLTGNSWKDVQVISEPVMGQNFNTARSWRGDIAVENGNVHVVWDDLNESMGSSTDRDIFYRCNLKGSSWEDIQVISEPILGSNYNNAGSYLPEITTDDNKIYVVWADVEDTDGSGTDVDIFLRCKMPSSDWEQIQVISEPVPGQNFNTVDSNFPDVAVENGKIFVTWSDLDDTHNSSTMDSDIFYRCNIDGLFWDPIQVISEPVPGKNYNNQTSYHPRIAVDNGKICVVWDDYNNTNGAGYDRDVFFRWKRIPYSFLRFPKVTPLIGDTNTEFNFTVTYYQLNNTPPTCMKVIIDGIEYSMLENDLLNTNFINGKKYYLKIKNLNVGSHTYQFKAASGETFTTTKLFNNIIVENTLPQIITENNQTATQDQYYEVKYEFIDMDIANVGQTYYWEFATNASWLTFNNLTSTLYGTPTMEDVGRYWVSISIVDGNNGRDWSNFTLTVIDINDAPTIETESVTTAYENNLYSVDYNATDIDDPFEFNWDLLTNASWLSIDKNTGLLSGIPENDDVGYYFVNITVEDVREGMSYQNFTLRVINVNDAPVWKTIPIDINVHEGEDFIFDVNATDFNFGEVLTYDLSSTPKTNITINRTTGIIYWNGDIKDLEAPEYALEVNLSVTDGEATIWETFKIKVIPNQRPTTKLISPANNSRESAIGLKLTWIGSDKEDDSITYVLYLSKDLSSVLNRLKSKRMISHTNETSYSAEDLDVGGIYFWTVIPFDDFRHGICNNSYFVFEINNPPTILSIPYLKTTVGKKFQYELLGQDSNEDDLRNLRYNLESAPEGMSINSSTGILTWTPTKVQTGNHSVKVWISDGIDKVNISFEIIVTEKNLRTENIFVITSVSFLVILAAICSFFGTTEVGKYKFLTLFFVPLYNRLHRDKVLDNYTRGQIHGYIKARPGEHYNAIKSALELKNGNLAHHLRILEKEGFVISKRDGFYTRFYPKGMKISEPETFQRNLIHIIDTQPGITQSKIVSMVESSQQVVSYNLLKLTRDNILRLEPNGREKKYYINYEAADFYHTQDQDLNEN